MIYRIKIQININVSGLKMNIQDAANILGISGEITPEISKIAYRRASMKFHPDRNPAGLVMMQAINAAYELIQNYIGKTGEANEYAEELSAAINAVVTCPGIIIEVCGNWVWLSGETRAHKEIIKEAGFKWASKKFMWFFRPEEWRSSSRQNTDIDKIRDVYGSTKIKTELAQAVAA